MIDPAAYNGTRQVTAPIAQGPDMPKKTAEAGQSFHHIASAFSEPDRTAGMANSAAVASPDDESGAGGGFIAFLKNIIDIINPLQHIPVISTIYRHLTGDEISPAARLAGDTLYGGPIGAAVAMADITTEKITGRDVGGTVMAMLSPKEKEKTAPDVMVASAAQLNGIAPAAGETIRDSDIQWDSQKTAPGLQLADAASLQNNSTDLPAATTAPTKHRTVAAAMTPASYSLQVAQPVPPLKREKNSPAAAPTAAAGSAGQNGRSLVSLDSITLLQSQNAPAAADRTALAPEQIATQMLQNLDQYAAMKGAPQSLAPYEVSLDPM